MAKILPFTQGVSGAFVWPLLSSDGITPAIIPADYTVKSQIRSAENSSATLLAELTGTVVNSNSVEVSWTDAESRAWDWDVGYMDVILRDGSGSGVQVVWKGKASLRKVVTAP